MASARAPSSTPVPTTETAESAGATSTVTAQEWEAMTNCLKNVYDYRTDDGADPTKLFQRKVNKRAVPDYYDIIKEPMALSTIKSKISNKEYKNFSEFVRDLALIPHNAQVYNRQDSQAYVDALEVKKAIEQELKKLVDDKTITESREGGSRAAKEDIKNDDPESRKKRGRPPRVDTPMEARIKTIMKAIRKPRNQQNKLMVSAFERVPDKTVMPEYHSEIKNPMAMDILKRKLKRKKYNSVDHFMVDVELMFENAKQYNEEDSQIYKDAVHLQKESRKVAKAEKEKPDTEYVMEEGRIPMPSGIVHNGELWKVGDWVHIQNANDLTKPIVAQIYRTWQDANGGQWVNACWYYRPEQTVHRFDRHFFENEVVKTGQYRDHRIDEVVDRCFVMFITRYNKGRPRDFPSDKEIYVCEARYNEENHKLNKIKTWASCLPDEVRDKDYVMDLFDAPRKLKKVPSPIAYLLKDEQKEDDDLPKPEWGAENAPPKIGAVHRRPRDPKHLPPNYKAPQPVEVYVMADHANASIPLEIREQFQRDEKGRVLFFTAPPLNVEQPLTTNGRALGHSARYLAAKAKKEAVKASKRKADAANAGEREAAAKKAKADEEDKFNKSVQYLGTKALKALEDQLAMATKADLTNLFHGQDEQGVKSVIDQLAEVQKAVVVKDLQREIHVKEREESKRIPITGMTARLEEKY
ncbi:Transcription factor [Pyrenophora tritici-repentis]|uniref:Transcription factor involved in chromatin remodeling, contains bromodomain protein n=1 Tax=Pyrenophora tritici-repentis TaxID=45151 RepID=A0A2W1FED0_9PLEO|nr:Chromatin structure-remodeling complex protein rsc1 [Pyrenophora tritici-repentis]KAF7445239.1 Chromatin structure-remodeling complex protein rsc1 [Pyrenophora tritici-repentis]KAF7565503.1 Transcription factor involved in chromatin remodeling, contains bromodomain protein [Pyrenophora tritici-repentis]KAG9380363.1 Chromatin structure-remodeling complex protein rsc1 [Pyrenophora tritici-repentis]KAI0584671.1 Chromatin structure-remodeling complex protein rsc1 [Pyrenophora tritici-repentis]